MQQAQHAVDSKRRMDDTKLLWHADRVYERLALGRRIAPIHIDVGLAKFCNIQCVFCFALFQNPSKEYIKRDALLTTMRLAPKIGIKSMAFVGDGEPTCNPHLYEALAIGNESGLDLSISTNGLALNNDERCLAILRNCKWMRFCISAGTRDGYQKIHQRDYYDRVLANIRRTIELREQFHLDCEIGMQAVFVPTIMIDEMVAESQLAIDLGVDYFVIKQCSLPDGTGKSGMLEFDVNYYDRPEVKEALTRCQGMSTDKTEIIPKWNMILQKGKRPYNFCKAVSLISEMSGNGDWYPCGYMFQNPQFEDCRFGNLHEQTIEEIWQSERYWRIVERMENQFDVHRDCKGCCRLDKCNEWTWNYSQLNRWGQERIRDAVGCPVPDGVNFI